MDGKRSAVQNSQVTIPLKRKGKMSQLDDDYSTLSGKPFCSTVMTPTNLEPFYRMVLGVYFQQYLPAQYAPVSVICRGKTWEIMYSGDKRKNFSYLSWKKFAKENDLKVGDVLFWEVMGSTHKSANLKVQIIKGELPYEAELVVMKKEDGSSGSTSYDPIMIE